MTPDPASIQRLGFEAWADNIIVNAIEGIDPKFASYLDEQEDLTVVVRVSEGVANATVRAYIAGSGWYYHDRVIKLKGSRP